MNNAILIQPATGKQMLLMAVTRNLHEAYCKKWNIDYRVVTGDKAPHKACLILNAFDAGYEYVFVLDADTMVVDDTTDMREACLPGLVGCTYHAQAKWDSQCYNHWNIGAMFTQRTGYHLDIEHALIIWCTRRTEHEWGEQHTFNLKELRIPKRQIGHEWNSLPSGPFSSPNPIVIAWHGCGTIEQRFNIMLREYKLRFGSRQNMAGKHLDLHLSAMGIGDAISALYCACGAADATGDVTLHTRHTGVLARVSHPGLKIVSDADPNDNWVDISTGYNDQLFTGQTRKEWYCDSLLVATGLKVQPTIPKHVDRNITFPRRSDRYVVFAPFSCYPERHWLDRHWRRLLDLVQDSDRSVAIIDSSDGRERVQACFGNCESETCSIHYGENAAFVIDLMLGADCVVGVDSGPAHIGGLLGVPTVAIMSQLDPESVFSHTKVVGVTPTSDCVFCRWQPSRGYRPACASGCSAIATVSPEEVLASINGNENNQNNRQ